MNKLLFPLLLLVPSISFSQEKCKVLTEVQYKQIYSLAGASQNTALRKYLKDYCFDPAFISSKNLDNIAFYIYDLDLLNEYSKIDKNFYSTKNRLNRNLLSNVMISHLFPAPMSGAEYEKKRIVMADGLKQYSLKEEPYKKLTLDSYNSIIDLYTKNIPTNILLEDDVVSLNSLDYSIITVNPRVFQKINPNFITLIKPDSYSNPPIYYFFAPKYPFEKSDSDNEKLNNLLMSKVNQQTIGKLVKYKRFGLSFYEFAEIMKDNNLDLYNKLKNSPNFMVRDHFKDPKIQEDIRSKINEELDLKVKTLVY